MPQPTTLSTSSVISPQQEHTEPSEHRPCRRGVKSSLRREPNVPAGLLRAVFGNVTTPADETAKPAKNEIWLRDLDVRFSPPSAPFHLRRRRIANFLLHVNKTFK